MLKWEIIPQDQAGTLYRCKVPNGWLVKEVQDVCQYDGREILAQGYSWTSSIAFIPDSHHEWDINKEPEIIETKEDLISKLIKTIPSDLITMYYLETTNNGEHSKKLKRYILDNVNGVNIHLLLNEFNLITTNINK